MKTFKVTREDDCVYVEDLRDKSLKHITTSQVKELINELHNILKKEEVKCLG